MNRMERIINLGEELLNEMEALSNDDWGIEDKEEYARVEGKQAILKEEIAYSLFIFGNMCLQHTRMTDGDIISAKKKVPRVK